jgi:single-strand DNA-binding protein
MARRYAKNAEKKGVKKMLNSVQLMGRITHTPELKTTQSGKDYLRFTIAINNGKDQYGNEREPYFIDCTAWEKTAVFIYDYFNRGSLIALEGSIQTSTYEGKDGKTKKRFEVRANRVHFTGEKKDDKPKTQSVKQTELPDYGDDEDLPF